MNKTIYAHETLKIGILLAITAGIFDSYTYLEHGEVFAGLQTGNIVLLGINILHSNFTELIHYLIPISAFMLGVIGTRIFQQHYSKQHDESLRPIYLMIVEVILIILTAFLSPFLSDRFASALISITAAIQLQEFRKLKDEAFTSLMMTGNLRTVAEGLYDGIAKKDWAALRKGLDTLIIILSFLFGAFLTSLAEPFFGEKAVLLSAVSLIIAIVILFNIRNQLKNNHMLSKS